MPPATMRAASWRPGSVFRCESYQYPLGPVPAQPSTPATFRQIFARTPESCDLLTGRRVARLFVKVYLAVLVRVTCVTLQRVQINVGVERLVFVRTTGSHFQD